MYRNNFKIYGHGEEDWLKLAEKRVARTSRIIDNKLTFGYITLNEIKSIALEEKTNREGFIKSDESKYLKDMISIIVDQFGLHKYESTQQLKKFIHAEELKKIQSLQEKNLVKEKPPLNNQDQYNTQTQEETKPDSFISDNTEKKNDFAPDNQKKDSLSQEKEENIQKISNKEENKQQSIFKNKYIVRKNIGTLDENIKKDISSTKVFDLINEITTIDITKYTLATSFLFRSLIEVSISEYYKRYELEISKYFKDYIIDENNNLKKQFINPKTGDIKIQDIPIRKKITDFKGYLSQTSNYDNRSLKHLDSLAIIIDDINLAIHWSEKKVSINDLSTNWSNSLFLIEYLCSRI